VWVNLFLECERAFEQLVPIFLVMFLWVELH
jgi:hypothetical protein